MGIKSFFKNLFKKKKDVPNQSIEIEDVSGDVKAENVNMEVAK